MSRADDATMLAYFWTEKGDPTRYINYEECIDSFPMFKQAWINYRLAASALDAEADKLSYIDEIE